MLKLVEAQEHYAAKSTFKVAVNRMVIDKNNNGENLATGFVNMELSQLELAAEINKGFAFTTQHNGRRKQDNFVAAGYVALDFDKTSPEEMNGVMADPVVKNHYGIFYHTVSSTKENPKFRVLFQLDNPILDREVYRKIQEAFIWRFSATADSSCKDPCRLFFGSKNSDPKFTNNVLPQEILDKVLQAYEKDQKYEEDLRENARKISGKIVHNISDKSKKLIFDKTLDSHCARIRSAELGNRHYTLVKTARTMGGYLAGEPGVVDEYDVRRRLEEAYSSHSGYSKKDMMSSIDFGLKVGQLRPLKVESLTAPEHSDNNYTSDEKKEEIPAQVEPKKLLWKLSELENFPKPTYLIENIIKRYSLAFLIGPPKCGKSFYSLDLACQVAVMGGKVIYIGSEDPGDFYQRGMAWCDYHKCDRQLIDDNLLFWVEPIALHDDKLRKEFLQLITADFTSDLIVVDTLAMNSSGLDENSAKDMGIFINALIALKNETKACILTIHHTNKNGVYRGSSVLPGSADTFMLATQEGDKLWKGGQLKIVCDMQKSGKPFDTKYLRAEMLNDTLVLVDLNQANSKYAPKLLSEMDKEILKICNGPEGAGGMSVPGIVKLTDWPKDDDSKRTGAYRACRELAEDNYLTCIKSGKNTYYEITPKGRDIVVQGHFGF